MPEKDTERAVLCKIVDAKFEEDIGDGDATYSSGVKLLVEILNNGFQVVVPLTDDNIEEFTELGRLLSTKEKIKVAQKLSAWRGNVILYSNPDNEELTVEMLRAEEKRLTTPVEAAEDDPEMQSIINLEDVDDVPLASATVQRFAPRPDQDSLEKGDTRNDL